jgi:hypothetical protein
MRRLQRITMVTTVIETKTTLRLHPTPVAAPTTQTITNTLLLRQVVTIRIPLSSPLHQQEQRPRQISHMPDHQRRIRQPTLLFPHIILKTM